MAARRRLGLGGALLLLAGCGGRSELFEWDASGTATGGRAAGNGASGGKSVGASGGVGGQPPHRTGQVDLLLTVDNSIGMADKQELLADALPALLERLANGSSEFSPVSDIHIGVISSSLGAHGAGQTCADEFGNDKAQLLAKVRLPDASFPYQTWNDSGFLAWDPDSRRNAPPGETSLDTLSADLKNMVMSAGQTGCGFEASLEAWYRFLVDPDPPESIPEVTDSTGFTTPLVPANPKQNPILVQRAAFLRPDSALVILMLSDENDCSIQDAGQGWLVGKQSLNDHAFRMPRATSVCETNPNDRCCQSCASGPIDGCLDPRADTSCSPLFLESPDDSMNLRCWDQKRRFGVDLLYPISRYVAGLTQTTIVRSSGDEARNPLFPKNGRTQSQVFLSGIVGVPWQDLATQASLEPSAPLEYLNHEQLTAQGRWSLVLGSAGDPATGSPPTPPGDKLMFETNLDRTTLFGTESHPLLGARGALAAASSLGLPNPINGREGDFSDGNELQHACIFQLAPPRDCADQLPSCACRLAGVEHEDAVCKGTIQTHAKAWPGVRELAVLKAFGDLTGNAIPASICPKVLGSANSGGGYAPIVSALVNRLQSVLVP